MKQWPSGRTSAHLIRLLAVVILCTTASTLQADLRTQAIREAAEFVVKKFSKEAAGETVESLTGKITALATRHGDEAIEAVRRVGPRAIRWADEAGEHGTAAVRLMARMGDDAVWVARDPKRLSLFAKWGDDAAEAMIKHKDIADDVIAAGGKSAARALRAVDGRNARRLAMMAEGGELAGIGRTPQLMGVIQRFGNRGMDFIWRNKGVLVGAAVVSAFVANPEPYIDGTLKLADAVADRAAGPLAERAVDRANWTLLFGAAGAIGIGWIAIRTGALRRVFSKRA